MIRKRTRTAGGESFSGGGVVVRPPWVPARAEPAHSSEMVTQWLCGEALEVVDRSADWTRCRGLDGYAGWTPAAGLIEATSPEPSQERDSRDGRPAWSLGVSLSTSEGARRYLPWGARVQLHDDGRVELPGGSRAAPAENGRIVPADELSERFPPSSAAIVQTAGLWEGVPYIWGGRTDIGADCSGFVQMVFATHGVTLPRDSDLQGEVGPLVEYGDAIPSLELADLLFFAPERRGITHVVLAIGGTRVIHCAASIGSVATIDLAAEGAIETLLRDSIVCVRRPLQEPAERAAQ